MSEKYKAHFRAGSHGERSAWVTNLAYGPTIRSQKSESRFGATIYPRHVTMSNFSLTLAFSAWAAADSFAQWIEGYQRKASGLGGSVPPMGVMVPERKFLRPAIPLRGMVYGDEAARGVHSFTVQFEGVVDPVRPGHDDTMIPTVDPAVAHFYPAGIQLSGSMEDDVYGTSDALSQGFQTAIRQVRAVWGL